MSVLTVKTGPLAGRKFPDLWELMDAQQAVRDACKHPDAHVITGTCGQGIRKKKWARKVCPTCHECLSGNEFTPTPDLEGQKRIEAEFWRQYRPAKEGETPTMHVYTGHHPGVGLMVLWSTYTPHRRLAKQNIKENMGLEKTPRDSSVIGVVRL